MQLANFIDWIHEHPKEQEIPDTVDLDGCLGDSWLFELAYDDYGNEKLIEESAVLAWIRYHHKQQIPQIMRFKGFQYKGYTDVTPISIWIQYRRYEPVPQYLIYSGCQNFYDFAGRNLLMNWMKYRPDEPIPDFLQGPDWEQTFDKEYGDLPATSWIKYGRGPIPSELQFKDWIKVYEDYQQSAEFIQHRVDKRAEEEGEYSIIPETVLHLWVKYRPGEEIPDEFLTGYPYSASLMTANVIYDSIVSNKGALPPARLRFKGWEKIRTIEKNTPLFAWIESSNPKDANIPSELLYPNTQRIINCYGASPLTWWIEWKKIKITGIPERLLYKHCITPEFIKEWQNTQKKNTPIPQNVIKRHFGTATNYKFVYEKPNGAPEKPECCICFEHSKSLLYPCKNKHPDGAICIDCYLQLIAQHSQCPLCRGKLL